MRGLLISSHHCGRGLENGFGIAHPGRAGDLVDTKEKQGDEDDDDADDDHQLDDGERTSPARWAAVDSRLVMDGLNGVQDTCLFIEIGLNSAID
jgi:hypothetical protein